MLAEVGGQRGEVGRLVDGPDPPGLDPGEVEQRVDQLLEPQGVAVDDFQSARAPPGSASVGAGEQLLDRAEHQRQRRAELVADVGEERGLGAVQLGQRLGPPPLLLVGAGVGDGGGDVAGQQVEEPPVVVVERPAGG